MANKAVLCLSGLLVVFILTGCASEVAVEPGVPVCASAETIADAMDICEDVLVRMYFDVEKFDTAKGYIKTRPLRGAQFFEFWRIDNAGSKNAAYSNQHSILRTAELKMSENAGQFCVECNVQMRRLSIPETEVTSYSLNKGIFSGGSRTFQKIRPKDPTDLEWIAMGRDTELEKRILGRILYKFQKIKK